MLDLADFDVELDFYTDPYSAILDHENGYACLSGRELCYVWSLARVCRPSLTARARLMHASQTSSTSSPTCYIFPVPSSPSSSLSLAATIFSPVPFVAFVSQGGSGREPGFLLIGTTGAIRYWSSISQALSDVQRCSTASVQLTQGELVRAVHLVAVSSHKYTWSVILAYSTRSPAAKLLCDRYIWCSDLLSESLAIAIFGRCANTNILAVPLKGRASPSRRSLRWCNCGSEGRSTRFVVCQIVGSE